MRRDHPVGQVDDLGDLQVGGDAGQQVRVGPGKGRAGGDLVDEGAGRLGRGGHQVGADAGRRQGRARALGAWVRLDDRRARCRVAVHVDAEPYGRVGLHPGARHLAVAPRGVRVAEGQQRAHDADREHQPRAGGGVGRGGGGAGGGGGGAGGAGGGRGRGRGAGRRRGAAGRGGGGARV